MPNSVSFDATRAVRRPWVLLFIAIGLIALNLRMTITGVGPLLDQIAAEEGSSPAALGMLGSLPLLVWGALSSIGYALSARFGLTNSITWALLALIVGTVWRSLPGAEMNLWVGTALIGVGLAIGNVLTPVVIRRDFPDRLPLVMGAYSALLSAGAAVAAGIVVPVSQTSFGDGAALGWRIALLCTGMMLLPALLAWVWATRARGPYGEKHQVHRPDVAMLDEATGHPGEHRPGHDQPGHDQPGHDQPGHDQPGRRMWVDPLAWLVAFYMGSQSLVFYVAATWLPSYSLSLGRSAEQSGFDLITYQLTGVLGSLLLPLALRGRKARAGDDQGGQRQSSRQRWAPAALGALSLIFWLCIFWLPGALPLWLLLCGVNTGALFTMSMTLIVRRARTNTHASALSSMVQTVGYLIAAIGPTTFGWLYGLNGAWLLPFVFIWLMNCTQIVVGTIVGRPLYVLDRPVRKTRAAG